MSQLRNLLTNKVLRHHGVTQRARREFFRWMRRAVGEEKAAARLAKKGN